MAQSRGLTIIETAVVGVVAVFAGTLTINGLSEKSQKAQTTKCLNNLKRGMDGIQLYTNDYNGFLPGPIFNYAVHLNSSSSDPGAPQPSEQDRYKTILWHLKPYFESYGSNPEHPSARNPILDKVFTCPTVPLLSGTYTGKWSYTLNTFGPYQAQSNAEWYHTDPPFYFGIWYYLDSWPENHDIYRQRAWRPKAMETIANSSLEWVLGDNWYRKQAISSRPGGNKREFLGTMPMNFSSPAPSLPFHEIHPRELSTNDYMTTLPRIDLEGKTNLAYFDGHASSFVGNWRTLGDGGTVNPFWREFDGTYNYYDPCLFNPDCK